MGYFQDLVGIAAEENVYKKRAFWIIVVLSFIVILNSSIAINTFTKLDDSAKKAETSNVAWESICLSVVLIAWAIPIGILAKDFIQSKLR